MDTMINVRMPSRSGGHHGPDGPDGHHAGLVCEVQIVHRQLLTIRSEMGAHRAYVITSTLSPVHRVDRLVCVSVVCEESSAKYGYA
jgi:hypothetical protein